MFKCDMCRDLLARNETPYCMKNCPQKAMKIGKRTDIFTEAEKLKDTYNGYIYGQKENGGTSTLYISPVSFDDIETALDSHPRQKGKKSVGFTVPENLLTRQRNWALLSLVAPIAGVIAALGFSSKENEEGE